MQKAYEPAVDFFKNIFGPVQDTYEKATGKIKDLKKDVRKANAEIEKFWNKLLMKLE